MTENDRKIYRPCATGLKCPNFYRSNFLREHGNEAIGTGDIVEDLRAVLQALNSTSIVEGRDCTEGCPIPGQGANVEGPDGRLHKVFFKDLPSLVEQFE